MNQYIFLDESGDLGFNPKKKNSQFFIITVIFTKDKKLLEKAVKKIHKGLRKKVKKLSGGILHAYKEKPITRKRLLRSIVSNDCKLMAIYLNKTKVYTKLQNEKHVLYNYVVNILLDRIMTKKHLDKTKPITLIAAKRETTKFLNENFKDYLQKQIKEKHKSTLTILIKNPSEEKSLQATDFVSWAFFRKYEQKDEEYYRIIKACVVEESGLFS